MAKPTAGIRETHKDKHFARSQLHKCSQLLEHFSVA